MPILNGKYVPEDAIAQSYKQADNLSNQRWAPNIYGNIAAGIGAVGGNILRGSAQNALTGNQDMRTGALRDAAAAPDNASMAKILMERGVPGLDETGFKMIAADRQGEADANKPYRIRAVQAEKFGFKRGTPEFNNFVLTGEGPKDPLDAEYKRAQIKSLTDKSNDPIEQLLMERLRGGAPQAAPQSAPMRPYLQPQSMEGGQPMPGVQLISDEQAPAQAAPPAMPDANMIETPFGSMTRDEARALAGPMLLSPKYSAAGKAIMDSLDKTGSELSKPAATQLDERTISAASTLGRLQTIRQQYKPEFLQIPSKLKLLGASWGASFGGKLSPDLQKQLGDFSAFKATAFDNFNQLLKELSGTAVSAQELSRQKIVQPNPGEGILDGDDPITFMSKIDQGEKIAKAAMARMNFMRSRGIQFNKDTAEQFLRLEDVPAAIDRRGAEIEQQIRQSNPQLTPQSLEQETAKRLKQEFGI